jgi:protein PhnA
MTEVLEHSALWECVTCGHEWERIAEPDAPAGPRIVRDAHGNILADGDVVMLIKDLPLKGSSQVLKGGTKSKPIKLVEGDHEISCRIEGQRPSAADMVSDGMARISPDRCRTARP